jgi:hypothetical protein
MKEGDVMLRKSLLATTALVMGAALALAAHERGVRSPRIHPRYRPENVSATLPIGKVTNRGVVLNNTPHWTPGAMFSNFSRDRNAEFISWYGFRALDFAYSSFVSQYTWFKISSVGYNAFPFHGGGRLTAMTFAGFASSPDMEFKGAILSATASGLPGHALASTSSATFSNTSLCCTAARTVKFVHGAKSLPDGNYFAAVECASTSCEGGWAIEDTDYSGAAADYWFYRYKEVYAEGGSTFTYTYSTPWHESAAIPAVGAVIIK